ncbi:MAG: hypothetical protein DWQ40_04095 [Actinobacteria bacterium]|nr:MAG: hypothetical protein DWQ40_04095 [Actinomycetota bacterium]
MADQVKSAEDGHAGVELALAVAVLLIPVAVGVLAFAPWTERSVLAEAAAAEAARAAVLALSVEAGSDAVDAMAQNYGLGPDQIRLGWCGADPAIGGVGSCPMGRGAIIEVAVQVWVPMIMTPWGEVGGIWIGAEHAEVVDLYRSIG